MQRQIAHAVQLTVDGGRLVHSAYVTGLVASLRVVSVYMVIAAGSSPEIDVSFAITCRLIGMRSGRSCLAAPAWRLH